MFVMTIKHNPSQLNLGVYRVTPYGVQVKNLETNVIVADAYVYKYSDSKYFYISSEANTYYNPYNKRYFTSLNDAIEIVDLSINRQLTKILLANRNFS